jgi:hypothetical protein
MSKVLVLLAGLLLFSAAAFASDSSSGCGLGWMILKKNSLVSSSLRATTNGIFFNATFGMTSGTSGCAKHDIVQNEKKAIHFAEANFGKLMQEMSQGSGEYLTSFSAVLGCKNNAGFSSAMQKNFSAVADATNGVALYNKVSNQFNTNLEIQKACGTI